MSSESQSEDRDLPASERKIQKSREDGDVARSREFSGASLLLVAVASLYFFGPGLSSDLKALFQETLSFDRREAFDPAMMSIRFVSALTMSLFALLPYLGALILVAVLASVCIGGLNWSWKPLSFNISKLNPVKGLSNIFSTNGLAELAKAIFKTMAVGGVGFYLVYLDLAAYSALSSLGLKAAIIKVSYMALENTLILAAIYFFISAFDVPYQLWRHAKKLRMSFDELKKENKESDGDPHLKARIRSIQREMAKKRMMSSIPSADVIITNPTHYAVAIKYERDKRSAPLVVAKGVDEVAARIREIGGKSEVPIIESPPLARSLYKNVEVGREIPDGLYKAVAKVLAYVYALSEGRHAETELPTNDDIPKGMDPLESDK